MGNRPWDDALSQELDLATDVSRRGDAIAPIALLLLHGQRDPDVSAASAQALYEALRPSYTAFPERLDLRIYPALGHTISRPENPETAGAQQELRDDVNRWFRRFL
jgi:predicted esterase